MLWTARWTVLLASTLAVVGAGCDTTTTNSTAEKTVTVTTPTEPAPTATAPPTESAPTDATVGDAIRLGGADDLQMRVTLQRVVDPVQLGEFESVSPGKRVVGIELRLTNESTNTTYDDSPSNGAAIVFGPDAQADGFGTFENCSSQSPKIAPGDSRRICIPFEVGANSSLKKFQLALDSGFSDENGEWRLPRRGNPSPGGQSTPSEPLAEPESSAAPATSGPESSDLPLSSCDQNIRAGNGTSCGFADNIFIEYARLLQAGDTASQVTLTTTSPATNKSYSVLCSVAGGAVQCRADSGAYVRFPQRAAEVY